MTKPTDFKAFSYASMAVDAGPESNSGPSQTNVSPDSRLPLGRRSGKASGPRIDLARKVAREAVRQQSPVSVRLVPGTDIVHVKVQGDAAVFESIGMPGLNTANGPKRLEYLSLPADKYTPHVAGGRNQQHAITIMSDGDRKRLLSPQQSLTSRLLPSRSSPGPTAFVNGGFYGNGGTRADEVGVKHYETHAPIGSAKIKGVKQPDAIRPEDAYAGDYTRLSFANGSHITLAPLLASAHPDTGAYESRFTPAKAAAPRYKFENTPANKPGELGHASHPNARSAIDVPADLQPGDTLPGADSTRTHSVRLAVAGDDSGVRGEGSTGMTMVEWSTTMARLGSLNARPGKALNCDGGASALIGVADKHGSMVLEVRGIETTTSNPRAANYVAVQKNRN